MMRYTPIARPSAVRRRAFSLVELLIVIAVIGILIALIAGAGVRLIGSQRERVTQSTLAALDRALEEYIATEGGIPPFPNTQAALDDLYLDVPGLDADAGEGFEQFSDPYNGDLDYPSRPDASVFIRQTSGRPGVDAIIEAIPDRFLLTTLATPGTLEAEGTIERLKDAPSVIDAWGTPEWAGAPQQGVQQFIYYVHPSNRLAQDLYGRCINRRPYFVSAGPDGFYGHPSELDLIRATYTNVDIPMPSGPSGPGGPGDSLPGPGDDVTLPEEAYFLRKARADNLYSYDVDTTFLSPIISLP